MNQKELTKTFMLISNWEKPFGFHNFHIKISASRVKPASPYVGSNFSRHLMSIWKAGRQSWPRQPPPPPQSSEPVMPVQFSIDDSHGLPFASHCLLSCFLVSSKKTWLALMCFLILSCAMIDPRSFELSQYYIMLFTRQFIVGLHHNYTVYQ